ncbi:MAG: methionine--tRNA ligase [Victivallales bacterium]
MSSFYLTTPIYYVNDKPHIGHAYTTILGNVITGYHRGMGEDVWFLTGTDEHGQKVQKAAAEHNMSPIEQCDSTVVRFQELWKKLGIRNDDFIRTTEDRHKTIVRKILQDLYDRDLIYKAEYKGHYCVPCERFFTDKDLVDGNLCPDCHRPTNEIIESNYFFRMSRYQEWLIDYIKTHPGFIQPAYRANETLGFLKKPLEDLCISRPKARLSWGIELPFDPEYVCYVWFDALINYISAIGYGVDDERCMKYWSNAHHLIGKDILTTHTVYWPTMLKAIGLEPPKTILAHGWWLIGRDKMSKSLGNVVNPMEMADKYGVDAFRYFLLSEMTLGQDAAFSEEAFVKRYNSDLANDLGNMLNRAVKLIVRYFDSKVPAPGNMLENEDKELLAAAADAADAMEHAVRNLHLDKGIETVMNVVRKANRYMETTAPWTLAKEGKTERLASVLYTAAETLRVVAQLLLPVMPEKMTKLLSTIGAPAVFSFEQAKNHGVLNPGSAIRDIDALFPRIQIEEAEAPKAEPKKKTEKVKAAREEPVLPEGIISITDFAKVKLITAKVVQAEKVPDAEKLLKLQVDAGSEKRQIVSGIAGFYTPEELIGKTIVLVANLKPAKIRGVESYGMLLAAKNGDNLRLVTVDAPDFPGGASVG